MRRIVKWQQKKGETSYGIGLALVRITQAILNDENSVLPVSCHIDGFLGIHDVYLGLPSIVGKNGIKKVLEIELSPQEQEMMKKSANTVKEVIKSVGL